MRSVIERGSPSTGERDSAEPSAAASRERTCARLGHRFREPRLLAEALTHASAVRKGRSTRSNERLEFLGDRVLGLVVAHMLLARFPHEPEGDLSRRHAALVRREALADVAASLGLGDRLTVARGEEEGGGRTNPAILADACEALIGAVYLDGGIGAAEAFVRRHWLDRVEVMAAPPRDAKTALQEWAQGRGLDLPVYAVTAIEGPPHAPVFEVEARLRDFPPATARGGSKRAAEQAAAEDLLAGLAAGTAAR